MQSDGCRVKDAERRMLGEGSRATTLTRPCGSHNLQLRRPGSVRYSICCSLKGKERGSPMSSGTVPQGGGRDGKR